MSWTANHEKHEARNEHGYRIVWAEGPRGTWFNGYSPAGKHIDAGYDKEIVKAMCDKHRENLAKDRAMYAAHKAASEVA